MLASQLCPALIDLEVKSVGIHAREGAPTLTIPECFWSAMPRLTSINIQGSPAGSLIFSGTQNAGSRSDPLLRFSPLLEFFVLTHVTFVNPSSGNGANNGTFTANWTSFLSNFTLPPRIRIENSNLGGPLPNSWPSQVETVQLANNRISGTIPASFFSNFTSIGRYVDLSGNALTGTIPSTLFSVATGNMEFLNLFLSDNALTGTIPQDLFANIPSKDTLLELVLRLDRNRLTGSILPDHFAASFPKMDTLQVSLGGNRLTSVSPYAFSSLDAPKLYSLRFEAGANLLTGSIPAFLDNMSQLSILGSATFNFSHNQLTGSLPASLAPSAAFPAFYQMVWYLDSNALSGTIPTSLLATPRVFTIQLFLSHNALTGSLPAAFWSNVQKGSTSLHLDHNRFSGPLSNFMPGNISHIYSLELSLSSNPIGGTIPEDFFAAFNPKSSKSLQLSNCGLIGSLPTSIGFPLLEFNSYDLSHNSLSGSFPWDDLVRNASAKILTSVEINAGNNQLTGSVSIPSVSEDLYHLAGPSMKLWLPYNRLTSLSMSFPTSVTTLDVSGNTGMQGTVPRGIFVGSVSPTRIFAANNTALSGRFPDIDDIQFVYLEKLDLSHTNVDFCGTRSVWTDDYISYCRLAGTNATNCQAFYPRICRYDDDDLITEAPQGTPSRDLDSPNDTPTASAPQNFESSSLVHLGLVMLSLALLMI